MGLIALWAAVASGLVLSLPAPTAAHDEVGGIRLTFLGPKLAVRGDTLRFQLHVTTGGATVALEQRSGRSWILRRRVFANRRSIVVTTRSNDGGVLLFRAGANAQGNRATITSNVVRVKVRASGVRSLARPTTVVVPSARARVAAVGGRETVTFRRGARLPKRGEVLVVPATIHSPGVLGRVQRVVSGNGLAAVVTSPVSLDAAYRDLSVAISGPLWELAAHNNARESAGAERSRAGRFAAECKLANGQTVTPTIDLSKLRLDFALTTAPPSIHFVLTGRPALGLRLQSTGSVTCSLRDLSLITILVPGTPIVVSIKPRFDFSASGAVTASLTWSPALDIGFDRAPGLAQEIHSVSGSPTSIAVNVSGQASAWLAGALDVSVAGRLGIVGAFGPQLTATATAPPPCVSMNATLKATLDAYANVFFKDFTFSLASGSYGNLSMYRKCGPAPPPPLQSAGLEGLSVQLVGANASYDTTPPVITGCPPPTSWFDGETTPINTIAVTQNLPSVAKWFVQSTDGATGADADFYAFWWNGRLGVFSGNLRLRTAAGDALQIGFGSTLGNCGPAAMEPSSLGDAYPFQFSQSGIGAPLTGAVPRGCGYFTISGERPYTVNLLLTDSARIATTATYRCVGGKVIS